MDKTELIYKSIASIDGDELKDFLCGNRDLDNFLIHEALPNHLNSLASTTVVFIEKQVIAYFTLKSDYILFDSPSIEKIPCINIERFAVSTKYQRKGSGTEILKVLLSLGELYNTRYFTVDAYVKYKSLYSKVGFEAMLEAEDKKTEPYDLVYMSIALY